MDHRVKIINIASKQIKLFSLDGARLQSKEAWKIVGWL